MSRLPEPDDAVALLVEVQDASVDGLWRSLGLVVFALDPANPDDGPLLGAGSELELGELTFAVELGALQSTVTIRFTTGDGRRLAPERRRVDRLELDKDRKGRRGCAAFSLDLSAPIPAA